MMPTRPASPVTDYCLNCSCNVLTDFFTVKLNEAFSCPKCATRMMVSKELFKFWDPDKAQYVNRGAYTLVLVGDEHNAEVAS